MPEQTGKLAGVVRGRVVMDDLGRFSKVREPGTVTLTVTGLPEDLEVTPDMVVKLCNGR